MYFSGLLTASSVTSDRVSAERWAALDAEGARRIDAGGEEAVVLALWEWAKPLAEARVLAANSAANSVAPDANPATPSAMIPVFQKATTTARRKKKSGAKLGHAGHRRVPPERIDHRQEHRAKVCPDCGGPLNRCAETRTRYVEDIPVIKVEVTEHTLHRDWYPQCQKKVEPPIVDALPGSTLG